MTIDNTKVDSIMYTYATNISQLEEENKLLKDTVETLKEEIKRFKTNPLMVCEIEEYFDNPFSAIVKIPNGNAFMVDVSKDCEKLVAGDYVLAEQKNLTVIKKIPSMKKFDVQKYVIMEKPTISWNDIGGLDKQANEIKEVIELPLKKPELFKKVGITPPKGILLYGEPGTGKTLLAKAVAESTNATFIEVVGSELVQKFIGEGAKLVKEIFQLAREKAPTVIFIDELDSLAATRIDVGTSGEREVQRTFMQLLAEIDGFNPLGDVKVIGCTNRKDILDPAILRPGRLDRLIFIPLPDEKGRESIFKIHTKNMKIDKKTNIKTIITNMDGFSGAEINAVCTEAGYFAISENRTNITEKDLIDAVEKVKHNEESEGTDYMRMFG